MSQRDEDLRPFRFEDLNGAPEPEHWGPKYSRPPKPAKVAVDRWPANCASGQKGDFDAKKHCAKLRAEFTAQANADRRAWAAGEAKSGLFGQRDLTIAQAYAKAMHEKRAARLGRAA